MKFTKIALGVAVLCGGAEAWSFAGHMVIARIAERVLIQKAP